MATLDRPADPARYVAAFKAATGALRDASVRFALFGSTALWGLAGREPRTIEDIDLLIDPGGVDAAAAALEQADFDVDYPPEGWLIKGWFASEANDEPPVLVDLIHRPTGMDAIAALDRAAHVDVVGMSVPVLSATDLLASKALTLGPSSLDAQSGVEFARLLREQVDWAEVERRVAPSPYARAFLYLLRELGIAV